MHHMIIKIILDITSCNISWGEVRASRWLYRDLKLTRTSVTRNSNNLNEDMKKWLDTTVILICTSAELFYYTR